MPYESMMYIYAISQMVVIPYPNTADAANGDQIEICG